jgi:Na+:H+ antiporter
LIESHVAAFVVLLMVAALVAVLTKVIPVPYVTVLAVIGGLSGFFLHLHAVPLTRSLILFVVLPGLLFEAAFNLRWPVLRKDLATVVMLATAGVLLTAALVALLGHALLGLPLAVAFVFGTMTAPTDPVAVVAVFRKLRVPDRLTTIVEGESLLNDGTGVVLFTIALQNLIGTPVGPASAALQFVVVSLGGVAVGAAVGFLLSRLTTHVDDPQVEITYTAIGAYGTYLLAESIHLSGILAVVVAAVVMGNYGRRGMSERTQLAADTFWDYIAFFLNSLIFLLIGLEVPWTRVLGWTGTVLAASLILLAARALTVYGTFLSFRWSRQTISGGWQHLIVWSGMRGAVALALALSLSSQPGSGLVELRSIVYGVVLVSIVFQGVTIVPLARAIIPTARARISS